MYMCTCMHVVYEWGSNAVLWLPCIFSHPSLAVQCYACTHMICMIPRSFMAPLYMRHNWYNALSPSSYSHSDPSLTSRNVHQVMEVVRQERWREVGMGLSVPHSILDEIDADCSSYDEKMSAVISYVVNIIPDITWEKIAAALYRDDEEKAVERVKSYLHILPGGSCFKPHNTVHSLNVFIAQPHLHHKVYLVVSTIIYTDTRYTYTQCRATHSDIELCVHDCCNQSMHSIGLDHIWY